MAEQRIERRLAAILAADVVGYSRLTRADEAGTRAQFNAHMRESIEPCITNRRGRLVTISGDSLLVEFPSVVDAVRCALDIQDGVSRRDAEVPVDRRMEFRIGINLGDVIVEGDDIHGDGVNPKVPQPRWSQATERSSEPQAASRRSSITAMANSSTISIPA